MTFIVEKVKTIGKKSGTSDFDWDAMHLSVVEQAGLQERETLTGVISLVIDLGEQPQEDAEFESNVPPEEEAEIEEKFKGTYFKDGKNGKRMRCWEQESVQCITLAVDFPDILIDRSEFFEGDTPKPLRLYLGGQFFSRGNGMIVGSKIPLIVTEEGYFGEKSSIHKMATAAKIIKTGEHIKPEELSKLEGASLQFEAQVYMRDGKDGKKYYTEYLRFVGGLPRGMKELELPYPTGTITFNGENDVEKVLNLRNHIKNTMKMADNYKGSAISKILDGEDKVDEEDTQKEEVKAVTKKAAKVEPKVEEAVLEDDDFDDIPF